MTGSIESDEEKYIERFVEELSMNIYRPEYFKVLYEADEQMTIEMYNDQFDILRRLKAI